MLGGQLLGIGRRRGLGDAYNAVIFRLHGSPLFSALGCTVRCTVRLRRAWCGYGSLRATTSPALTPTAETAGPHVRNRVRTRTSTSPPVRNPAGSGRRAAPDPCRVRGSVGRSEGRLRSEE